MYLTYLVIGGICAAAKKSFPFCSLLQNTKCFDGGNFNMEHSFGAIYYTETWDHNEPIDCAGQHTMEIKTLR